MNVGIKVENLIEMRLDKWLWAARFFKTRCLAQKAIELGRVKVNGVRSKSSKTVSIGDIIELTKEGLPYRLSIVALKMERKNAAEAQKLYREDEHISQKREELKVQIKAAYPYGAEYRQGRPTKRDRRKLDKLKRCSEY